MTGSLSGTVAYTLSLAMSRPLLALARSLLDIIPAAVELPVLSGPMRGQRWVVGAGIHSCWLGVYEIDKQRLLQRLLCPGDVFYDVGAHAGLFTLLAARLVGKTGLVVAFEPLPANLAYLRRHAAANRLDNVQVVAAAVGSSEGQARFEVSGSTYMGAIADGADLEVSMTTLDATLETGDARTPSLIKIDVEGFEDAVLAGSLHLLRRYRPRVLLAVHSDALKQRCIRRLADLGYKGETFGPDPSELLFTPVRA